MKDAIEFIAAILHQHNPSDGIGIAIVGNTDGFIVKSVKEYEDKLKELKIKKLFVQTLNSVDKENPILICKM